MRPEQADFDLPGYHRYWNSADKAGYSGTAIFTRPEPLAVTYDFGMDEHRHEGRVITAEYPEFYLVCCYTPNSKDQLARLDYRLAWEDDIRDYLCELDEKKPVVYCGDLNVAHTEKDIKTPAPTAATPALPTRSGEDDPPAGRRICGHLPNALSGQDRSVLWWSYRFNARKNNAGWRIDYFIVSGAAAGQDQKRRHLERGNRQRPLPGGAGDMTGFVQTPLTNPDARRITGMAGV